MAVTITLTAAHIVAAVYVFGASILFTVQTVEASSTVNPRRGMHVLVSFIWPLIFIQVTILGPLFDFNMYLAVNNLRKWWTKFNCDHDNIEQTGDYYEVGGKSPEKACRDCSKVWWED
jgi:hypothetical protein